MALSKDAFLQRTVKTKKVVFSDGESVYIRPLPANMFISDSGLINEAFRTEKLIINSLCDEDGTPWFNDEDGESMAALNLPLIDFNKLAQECLEINGLKVDGEGSAEKN